MSYLARLVVALVVLVAALVGAVAVTLSVSESLRVPLTILTISLLTPVFAWVSRKNPPRWLYRTKDDPPLFERRK
jgi:hypothetical protein